MLGDKHSYLPQSQEPLYERRSDLLAKAPFGTRLGGGEIRQVLGTPPVGRHRWVLEGRQKITFPTRPDSRQEGREQELGVGARLAGQHFLSSPPDLHRRGPRGHEAGGEAEDSDVQSDQFTSQATQVRN